MGRHYKDERHSRSSRKSKSVKHVKKERKNIRSKSRDKRRNRIKSPNYSGVPMNNLKRINKSKRSYIHENFKATKINDEPYIVNMKNFLNNEEIKELIRLAEHRGFERSNMIIDGELQINDYRTSLTSYLLDDGMPYKYSKPIENLIKRICYLCDCKRNQIEGLMMVKYEASEEAYFWDHVDYFSEDKIYAVDNGGQRVITIFSYLNTLSPEDEGETEFVELDLKSRPQKGSAVFWWNIDENGKMIPETKHRGNPVKNTSKIGLNIWVRQDGW